MKIKEIEGAHNKIVNFVSQHGKFALAGKSVCSDIIGSQSTQIRANKHSLQTATCFNYIHVVCEGS